MVRARLNKIFFYVILGPDLVCLKKMEDSETREERDIRGDKKNIALLLVMYILQGASFGFVKAVGMYLKKHATDNDQAEFSLVHFTFFVKLLFAPLIDCIFIKKFGRRKTWVIPMQYLMGISFFFLSMNLDDWLGIENGRRELKIRSLTLTMAICLFFTYLQDVALDGWSLTMLKRRNIEYAGSIQNIGGNIGRKLTYILPIVLDSKFLCDAPVWDFSQDCTFVSLANIMMLWSFVLMISTTFILIFKEDDSLKVIDDENCECKLSLVESYKYIWKVGTMRPMMFLVPVLLTYGIIGFAPNFVIVYVKIMDAGVPYGKFDLLNVLALVIQIILSVTFRHRLFGPRSLHALVKLYVLLIIFGVVQAVCLSFSNSVADENMSLPIWYISIVILVYNVREAFMNLMRSMMSAFFFKISDPQFGGIYTSFLATMVSIGILWPEILSLSLEGWHKFHICDEEVLPSSKKAKMYKCLEIDDFYLQTLISTVIGALWLCWSKNMIYKIENFRSTDWIMKMRKTTASIVEDDNPPQIGIADCAL